LLPVVAQALSEVLMVMLPLVTAPLLLMLGFVEVKQALVSVLGAETLRETEPVKPPDGERATVDTPLLPCVTVTLVAERVNDWLPLEDAETVMVSVPEEAVLAAGLDGV
jgi:hypothetical protein